VPARTFAPYLLRLRSAGRPAPSTASPGLVVSPGKAGRGSRKGIRLDLNAPAWLTFREAFNRGWKATCDGRDLGGPRPVDGYAMAWHVSKTCRTVDLAFAPNRPVLEAEIVCGLAALALAAILLAGATRRRQERLAAAGDARVAAAGDARVAAVGDARVAAVGDARVAAAGDARAAAAEEPLDEASPRRLAPVAAAIAAVILALAFGFVFAARATPLFAIGLFVVLHRGVSAKPLLALAGALLVVGVPVLTLLVPVTNRGGYDPDYAGERIAVHWVAAAAVALLIVAAARLLTARRRGGRTRA
jgi:arabinofuranan 3-O-arabinosyltransferase